MNFVFGILVILAGIVAYCLIMVYILDHILK